MSNPHLRSHGVATIRTLAALLSAWLVACGHGSDQADGLEARHLIQELATTSPRREEASRKLIALGAVVIPDLRLAIHGELVGVARQEALLVLGEVGKGDKAAQVELLEIMADGASSLADAAAAARGVAVSGRCCTDSSALRAFIGLLARGNLRSEGGMLRPTASIVEECIPDVDDKVEALRKGLADLGSARFCCRALGRFPHRQTALLASYRAALQQAVSGSYDGDPGRVEAERAIVVEVLRGAIYRATH